MPLGTLAIELPDAEYPDYFLTTFGKPRRVTLCECERPSGASLGQALHTLNGDILAGKIADPKGRIAQLLAANKPHDEIVDELYFASLCRAPTDAQREACKQFLAQAPAPRNATKTCCGRC